MLYFSFDMSDARFRVFEEDDWKDMIRRNRECLIAENDLDEEVVKEMDEYEIVEAFWGEELYWDFAEVKGAVVIVFDCEMLDFKVYTSDEWPDEMEALRIDLGIDEDEDFYVAAEWKGVYITDYQ